MRAVARWLDRAWPLPLAAWALLPALAVRLVAVPAPPEEGMYLDGPRSLDTLSTAKAVLGLAIGLWMLVHLAARLLARPRRARRIARAALPALPLVLAALAATLASPFPGLAWRGAAGLRDGGALLLACCAAYWYTAALPGPALARRLPRLLLPVAWTQILLGLGQALGHDVWQTAPGRWLAGTGDAEVAFRFAATRLSYGSLYQPNHYGMAMALFTVLAVALAGADPGIIWRRLWLVTAPAAALCLCLSQSRAGLIAAALGMLAWLIRTRRYGMLVLVAAASIALLGAGGGAARTVADVRAALAAAPGSAVTLAENRIAVRAPDGTERAISRHGGAWHADPGLDFTAYPHGWARLKADGAELFFFTDGDEVWFADAAGRLRERMAPAAGPDLGGLERLFSGRGYIWSRGLGLAAARPWLGYGPGVFPALFPHDDVAERQRHFVGGEIIDKPHGMWLQLLIGTGVIGLGAASILAAAALVRSWRAGGSAWAAGAATVAFLAAGLAVDATPGVAPLGVFVLGCAAAGGRYFPRRANSTTAAAISRPDSGRAVRRASMAMVRRR